MIGTWRNTVGMLACCAATACGSAPVLPTARPQPTTRSRPTELPVATASPAPSAPVAEERAPAPYPGGPALLDEVLSLITNEYIDAGDATFDTQTLRDKYRPIVAAADDRAQVYQAMAALVDALGDRHSRFVPPAAAASLASDGAIPRATAGIGALLTPVRGGALVQVVYPESPAARANIQARDRIIAVNGRAYTPQDGDLTGEIGDIVRLAIARPGTKPYDVVLHYAPFTPHIVPTSQRFAGDIGYLAIPSLWVDDMGDRVSGALTDLLAAGRLQGLIIDLRGNRGGWEPVLVNILGHFSRGTVGSFVGPGGVRPLAIRATSGPDLRAMPLIVLIDGETSSYAEVLAAVLRRESDAQIVGARSAGNTETIYSHTLSDGSQLWLAQERFRMRDGSTLEQIGVTPDIELDIDWATFSLEDDPHILDALRLLGAGPK